MLLNTIEEFTQFISLNHSVSFENLRPDIQRAETLYLKPYLGAAQYQALDAAYESGSLTAQQSALLPYCHEVIAAFTMHLYLPMAQVQISDAGVRLTHTERHVTAWQWQIDELNDRFLQLGYAAIDSLLTFLDANKDDYTAWRDADEYCLNKDAIINTYKEFNKHFYIQNSPTTFYNFKQLMLKSEQFDLVPELGQTFYDRIKNEIKTEAISTEVEDLMRWLKPAVAHFTVARALREATFTLRADGVVVNNYKSGSTSGNNKERMSLTEEQLNRSNHIKQDGLSYIALCVAFLKANATVDLYPEYYNEFILPEEEEAAAEDPDWVIRGDGTESTIPGTTKTKKFHSL
jgi:hypothetical protein